MVHLAITHSSDDAAAAAFKNLLLYAYSDGDDDDSGIITRAFGLIEIVYLPAMPCNAGRSLSRVFSSEGAPWEICSS
jgi:hypothetical protein